MKLCGEDDLEKANAASTLSGIELGARAVQKRKEELGIDDPVYYDVFDPSIPGWDDPKTFHSSDLWFWFETLAKCWRPFKGFHFDLARHMCNYMANFVKTGDPNGDDADGTPMPRWEPLKSDAPKTMDVITPDLEKLKSEIEILQAERIRQYEAYADGVITKEVFQTKKDKIGEAIREKQNKIDEVTGILEEADEIRSGIEEISEEGDRLVTGRGLTREMAEAFIDRIYVYDKDRIEVVFKSEDILNKALGRCG